MNTKTLQDRAEAWLKSRGMFEEADESCQADALSLRELLSAVRADGVEIGVKSPCEHEQNFILEIERILDNVDQYDAGDVVGDIRDLIAKCRRAPTAPTIMDAIKRHLISKGWRIDENAEENASGELREYIHPDNENRMKRAWLDAIYQEQMREEDFSVGRIVNGKIDLPCGDDLGGTWRKK